MAVLIGRADVDLSAAVAPARPHPLVSTWRDSGGIGGMSGGVQGADEEQASFAVITTLLATGGLEILVVGEVDLQTGPLVVRCTQEELSRQTAGGPVDVDVVLNAVTFIDSTGVVALVGVRDLVSERGGRLRLVAPSGPVRRVLELTGLGTHFDIE